MRPHAVVHRGRDDERATVRERGLGEDRIGKTVRELGQRVRGQRRDHEQVGVLEVRIRVLADRAARERRERLGGDEALRGWADERDDLVPGADEPPDELARLVGGDAARDSQKDAGHAHILPGRATFRPGPLASRPTSGVRTLAS
jgi:hypothetical protein